MSSNLLNRPRASDHAAGSAKVAVEGVIPTDRAGPSRWARLVGSRRAAPVVVLGAVAVLAACGVALEGTADRDAAVRPATTGGSTALRAVIDELVVVEEGRREGYARDLFDHWSDINGSGCHARQDVLLDQAISYVQRDRFSPCFIVEGDWYLPFDGQQFSGAPGDIDVDHVVALAEAWDSGADQWNFSRRRQFANDPLHLMVSDRQVNRDKADLDAGEWKPERRDAWCLTATMIVLTKYRYSLTIDPAERRGLYEMADTCDGREQVTIGSYPLPGTAAFDRLLGEIDSELATGR
jgi:hypothetical protein